MEKEVDRAGRRLGESKTKRKMEGNDIHKAKLHEREQKRDCEREKIKLISSIQTLMGKRDKKKILRVERSSFSSRTESESLRSVNLLRHHSLSSSEVGRLERGLELREVGRSGTAVNVRRIWRRHYCPK